MYYIVRLYVGYHMACLYSCTDYSNTECKAAACVLKSYKLNIGWAWPDVEQILADIQMNNYLDQIWSAVTKRLLKCAPYVKPFALHQALHQELQPNNPQAYILDTFL